MGDSFVVQKVLISLPAIFNSKVSMIKEMKDLKTLTLDQSNGTLPAYEIRTSKGIYTSKDATFKDDKKSGEDQEELSYGSNEEEENFVIRLKRGSRKYKGNLPFKCFNYGKVGHCASRCPHKE